MPQATASAAPTKLPGQVRNARTGGKSMGSGGGMRDYNKGR